MLNGQLRLCGKMLKSNYLFDPAITTSCIDEKVGGYDQEIVIIAYLKAKYFSEEVTAEKTLQLKRDLQYMYEWGIFNKTLQPCIKYLYDRVCEGCTLNAAIQLVNWLPIHPDISHAVFEFGRWLTVISKWDLYHATDLFSQLVLYPLFLENEKEWETVLKCHCICGLPWRKNFVQQPVKVKYGSSNWIYDWKSTRVTYKNKNYYERVDERIQWVSVWLQLVMGGSFSLGDSPKQMLAMVANSLH